MTPAEEKLWQLLRHRRLQKLKFRRQAPVSGYVADFYCHALRLVVELDGEVHAHPHQMVRDEDRDLNLWCRGYTVLRFSNRVLFEQPEAVLDQIAETAAEIVRKQEAEG
jgi:uroporphyrinogen-III synthase